MTKHQISPERETERSIQRIGEDRGTVGMGRGGAEYGRVASSFDHFRKSWSPESLLLYNIKEDSVMVNQSPVFDYRNG